MLTLHQALFNGRSQQKPAKNCHGNICLFRELNTLRGQLLATVSKILGDAQWVNSSVGIVTHFLWVCLYLQPSHVTPVPILQCRPCCPCRPPRSSPKAPSETPAAHWAHRKTSSLLLFWVSWNLISFFMHSAHRDRIKAYIQACSLQWCRLVLDMHMEGRTNLACCAQGSLQGENTGTGSFECTIGKNYPLDKQMTKIWTQKAQLLRTGITNRGINLHVKLYPSSLLRSNMGAKPFKTLEGSSCTVQKT